MAKDFQRAAVVLFKEAFEGMPTGQDYTWFVQGKEGIFDALDSVDAERASRHAGDASSIAAHAYHLLYAMRWANTAQGGERPEGSWEDSWRKQDATPEEWAALKAALREEVERFVPWLETNEDWSFDEAYLATLAVLPHVAYHLGAIRQLMKVDD